MLKWIKRKMRMKEYCKTIEQLSAPYIAIINGAETEKTESEINRAYIDWIYADVLADYKSSNY